MIEINTIKINYMGMLISFKTNLFPLKLINYHYITIFTTNYSPISDTVTPEVLGDPWGPISAIRAKMFHKIMY